ncbi:DUF6473 family protein [Mesobacterium pallidum]|uniref:DUF6473 family protein n=1 Tax=Mesobacterium pallidum TaxID=2872037 RepID=UPI001EE238C6|nr:DUF6473 family protein [Mesobacterium pallidum]
MTIDALASGALNYHPCRYGRSRLLFRGPQRPLTGDYIAFLGGTATYGKYIPRPFPALVEEATGLPAVNLGWINAGIDVFLKDPAVLAVAEGGSAAVVQITGAKNLSNRFYQVHPRRNDRFLEPTEALRNLYSDVDFTTFHFNRHMMMALRDRSESRYRKVVEEVRAAWVARMRVFLGQLRVPTVLLWIADHPPDEPGMIQDAPIARQPVFVDRQMIEAVVDSAAAYVEVVATPEAMAEGTRGMVVTPVELPQARKELPVAVHQQVAEALGPVLLDHVGAGEY